MSGLAAARDCDERPGIIAVTLEPLDDIEPSAGT
jgi:hypothetical protein